MIQGPRRQLLAYMIHHGHEVSDEVFEEIGRRLLIYRRCLHMLFVSNINHHPNCRLRQGIPL